MGVVACHIAVVMYSDDIAEIGLLIGLRYNCCGVVIVAINRAVNMIVGVVVRTCDIGCNLGLLDVV